jgi:hypothetical protein
MSKKAWFKKHALHNVVEIESKDDGAIIKTFNCRKCNEIILTDVTFKKAKGVTDESNTSTQD